jgi:hypothetical protein
VWVDVNSNYEVVKVRYQPTYMKFLEKSENSEYLLLLNIEFKKAHPQGYTSC